MKSFLCKWNFMWNVELWKMKEGVSDWSRCVFVGVGGMRVLSTSPPTPMWEWCLTTTDPNQTRHGPSALRSHRMRDYCWLAEDLRITSELLACAFQICLVRSFRGNWPVPFLLLHEVILSLAVIHIGQLFSNKALYVKPHMQLFQRIQLFQKQCV